MNSLKEEKWDSKVVKLIKNFSPAFASGDGETEQ